MTKIKIISKSYLWGKHIWKWIMVLGKSLSMSSNSFLLHSLLNTKLRKTRFLKLQIVTKKEKSILPWPDSHLLCLLTPAVHSKSPGTLFVLGKKCQIVYINRALKLCMKDFQFSQHRQMYLCKSGHHVENKILHLYQ